MYNFCVLTFESIFLYSITFQSFNYKLKIKSNPFQSFIVLKSKRWHFGDLSREHLLIILKVLNYFIV